jgi:hypothetical protein
MGKKYGWLMKPIRLRMRTIKKASLAGNGSNAKKE